MVYMTNCPTCGYNGVDGDKCPYCGNKKVTDSGAANIDDYSQLFAEIKKCESCEKEFDYHMWHSDKGWVCKECFKAKCKSCEKEFDYHMIFSNYKGKVCKECFEEKCEKCKDIKIWKDLEERELDYFEYNSICKKCNLSSCWWCEELIIRSDKNYSEIYFEAIDCTLKGYIHNECDEESLNQDG